MSRKGRGGHLIIGDGWDAPGMDALVLGMNHFAAAASWLRVDQDEVVAVNSIQRWSSMMAGTWLCRRRVAGTEEEEDFFFFSPWPKRYGRLGRLLGQARWADSVGFSPGKSFPLFFVLFLFLFSIFRFEFFLNLYSVFADLKLGSSS
jgi:hypothetical protein